MFTRLGRSAAIAAFCCSLIAAAAAADERIGSIDASPAWPLRIADPAPDFVSAHHLAALSPRALSGLPAGVPAPEPSRIPHRWYDDVETRTRVFIAASVIGVGLYGGIKWWDNGFRSGFRTQSEGWFGADTEKGGADKLGHSFGAYLGVRAGAEVLEMLGNSREHALKLASVTSLAVYSGIEILDGFSKNYRFSKEDAIANVAGVGLGWVLHRDPRLDALVDFRLYYRQSPEAKADDHWEPFADYNGQRYLFAFKASGVPALDAKPVMRYVELLVGYGVRGYDPPGTERSRHMYAGLGLNVSRVLDDTVFRDKRESHARRGTALFFELFQVPGTAAFADRKL